MLVVRLGVGAMRRRGGQGWFSGRWIVCIYSPLVPAWNGESRPGELFYLVAYGQYLQSTDTLK